MFTLWKTKVTHLLSKKIVLIIFDAFTNAIWLIKCHLFLYSDMFLVNNQRSLWLLVTFYTVVVTFY